MTSDQIAKANAELRHKSALDRMSVGNGERPRPACCRRRRAVGFVTLIFPQGLGHKICWTRFAARRRKPHAGGVCSPILTAWIRFNVPCGVAREISGPLPVRTLKRRERRSPIPTGLRNQAQGCEARATLGQPFASRPTPTGLRQEVRRVHNPVGVAPIWDRLPQGSSCLATLGFTTESLWDSDFEFPTEIGTDGVACGAAIKLKPW